MVSTTRVNKSKNEPMKNTNTQPAATPAIQVRGASKHYGALHAVDAIDLTVQQGEIFGLIGHNGAGKSTLFKMMLGLVTPTSGEILINVYFNASVM